MDRENNRGQVMNDIREEINMTASTKDMLFLLSEGNPGGLNVLMQLVAKSELFTILNMNDMNIRGTQIWLCYKDVCGQDMDLLIEKCRNRDEDMVKYVNEQGVMGNHRHKAVTSGASSPGVRSTLIL